MPGTMKSYYLTSLSGAWKIKGGRPLGGKKKRVRGGLLSLFFSSGEKTGERKEKRKLFMWRGGEEGKPTSTA